MRSLLFLALPLVVMSAAAVSQPAPNGARQGYDGAAGVSLPGDERATNSPPLGPAADQQSQTTAPGDLPSDYLKIAQNALAAGRTGEAHEALEMAQTRLLDRSVPLGTTNRPSDNPAVGEISRALQALDAHDRMTCLQLIQAALGSVSRERL